MENRRVTRNWKGNFRIRAWQQTYRIYIEPALGKKDVADVTRDDILKLLSPHWYTQTPTAKLLTRHQISGRPLQHIGRADFQKSWRSSVPSWTSFLELGRGRGISNLDKKARITRPAPLI